VLRLARENPSRATPTQQCVRADEERPALSAQQLAGRSKDDAVTLIQPRPGDLAAKNREFVPEHNDLQLLELARAQTQRRHRKRTPKQQVQQRHDQEAAPSTRVQEGRLYGCYSAPGASNHRLDLHTRQVRGCQRSAQFRMGWRRKLRSAPGRAARTLTEPRRKR
jgi:hypothetical protein